MTEQADGKITDSSEVIQRQKVLTLIITCLNGAFPKSLEDRINNTNRARCFYYVLPL